MHCVSPSCAALCCAPEIEATWFWCASRRRFPAFTNSRTVPELFAVTTWPSLDGVCKRTTGILSVLVVLFSPQSFTILPAVQLVTCE